MHIGGKRFTFSAKIFSDFVDLKIKDIVELLNVSEKTVYRWIKDKKIPCYRINHQYRFNRSEINEWILSSKIELTPNVLNLTSEAKSSSFYALLQEGGVYQNIPGNAVADILKFAIEMISTPANISKVEILSALLSREEMMTTAIGKGIAIPHPRNPIITDADDSSVSICYLENPTDFKALDGEPVHTLFIVLSNSPKKHLETLSKISYLCQMNKFIDMLRQRESKENILSFVKEKENEWKGK